MVLKQNGFCPPTAYHVQNKSQIRVHSFECPSFCPSQLSYTAFLLLLHYDTSWCLCPNLCLAVLRSSFKSVVNGHSTPDHPAPLWGQFPVLFSSQHSSLSLWFAHCFQSVLPFPPRAEALRVWGQCLRPWALVHRRPGSVAVRVVHAGRYFRRSFSRC